MRGGILLAVALGGLGLVAWHLVPRPTAPPTVTRVNVTGVEHLDPGTIRGESGLEVGASWTPQAEARALDALEQLPKVRQAHVDATSERASSDHVVVRIEVTERRPHGIVELANGQRHWADRDGVLLERADRPPPSLPIVASVETTSSPQGPQLKSEAALRALRSLYALGGERLRQYVSLRARGYDWILRTRDGRRALLPPRELSEQVARLERVVETLRAADKRGWRTLDLRIPGEVVIGR